MQPEGRVTNPFSAAVKKETRFTLPGAFPEQERLVIRPRDVRQEKIDKCVAQLVEMGYGYGYGGDNDEVDRLKIYAEITNGSVDDAIDMLEEEKRAWEGKNSYVF
jgi:hypothetical protein